jgi:HK97 family phage portal protein
MLVVANKRLVRVDGAKSWPGAGSRPRTVGARTSLELVGYDRWASYASVYASQPYIYALVNKLARGIARLPLATFEWVDQDLGTKRPARTSDLANLLDRPFPRGSRRKIIEALIGSAAVFGKGYLWKFRPGPGRPPSELWPLDPRFVSYEWGGPNPVGTYVYRFEGIKKEMPPEDVIHVEWWSPNQPRGTSPLEALAQSLALEDAASRYSISSFANAVRPSGALVHPMALTDDQRRELQAEIDEIHAGPDSAFRMLLLDGGLDWKTFSSTAADAQTIETRKLGHVEACAVYDIPPPVVHILDHATFSNVTEQNKALYRESLAPWLGMIEGEFDAQLIADEPLFDNHVVEFDLREVLRADLGERADAYVKLLSIYTPNELRAWENLQPIDHAAADAILLPLNYQPVGPDFELQPTPDVETRQLASMLVSALRDGNGSKERAKSALDSFLAAAES